MRDWITIDIGTRCDAKAGLFLLFFFPAVVPVSYFTLHINDQSCHCWFTDCVLRTIYRQGLRLIIHSDIASSSSSSSSFASLTASCRYLHDGTLGRKFLRRSFEARGHLHMKYS